MAAKTSIHVCVLASLGVEKRKLPVGSFQRENFGGRMARPFLAEIGILRVAKSRRKPNASFSVDHPVVIIGFGIPNLFTAPVWRRLHQLIACCIAWPERFGYAVAHRCDDR